jgi:hypothetical protein
MIELFSRLNPPEEVKGQGEVLGNFWGLIEATAGGEGIWQSQLTVDLRRYVEAKILPFASTLLKQWCESVPIVLPQIKARAVGATTFSSDPF